MPVYDEKLAQNRPGKGYLSHTSRHGRIRPEQGHCPMSSKAGMFKQETECNFIGEEKSVSLQSIFGSSCGGPSSV